jgi:hypothetical protein
MRRDILEADERGRVEMRGLVDSDDIDKFNADLRNLIGKGFTKSGNMRHVANVDEDEITALYLNGDIDAIAFKESGYKDREALRRLLYRFPQWRCSEGCV